MTRNLASLCLFALFAAACGGGGGGGTSTPQQPPIRPPQPPTATPSPLSSGVVAVAAGSGTVRVDVTLPGTGFEAALFRGDSENTVYAGTLVNGAVAASPVLENGLTDGQDVFFGLAIRAAGTITWTPVGVVARARPNAPIYVDASADPSVADGLSPATAFPSLLDAMLVAGSRDGANVWVRDGEYRNGPFPLGPRVHVAGGFDASFTLAARNVAAQGTRLLGTTGLQLVDVVCGGGDASLDGLHLDGGGTTTEGIDVTDSDVALRSLMVRRCTDRGVRAKVTVPVPNRDLQVVACTIQEHGSEGLSSAGPIDLRLDQSRFDANGQEGIDADNLEAPSGGTVTLHATACGFYGNVFEGLDADLAAAPLAATPGTFVVRIDNCSFERNGLDGLLIDQEHEFAPGFTAAIDVRGCLARGNRLAGVHIDADAQATYRLDRLRCTANAGDGVLVTSETNAGEVLLSASWLAGNLGAGARSSLGNKVLLASHCGFAGNQGGGLRCDTVAGAAVDCIGLGQPSLLSNAIGAGNVTADAGAAVFLVAPLAFTTVTAANQGSLTVAATTGFAAGTSVVAADDGRRLVVQQVNGSTLVLDQAPTAFVAPGSLAAYAGTVVADDLRLAAGSPALAAGITPAGVTAPDCGPFGAPAGGAPGRREPFAATTLQLQNAAPALATGVTANESLVLTFDRELDLATALPERIRVLSNGTATAAGIQIAGRTLTLVPSAGGWTGTLRLELHAGLRALDGSQLGAPLLLPVRIR